MGLFSSKCPNCGSGDTETKNEAEHCLNCGHSWY